ncbi:MAG: UvrD-helicase domain-containing protein [Bacilli bacterium]|nr:UvrD-helicase domain-containing protein [Bacilli bacterium]
MAISEEEILKEKKILKKSHNLIKKNIDELSNKINVKVEDLKEFKRLSWQEISSYDAGDIAQLREESTRQVSETNSKIEYLKKLNQIEKKPYFASIVFKADDGEIDNIYLSLTYLKDKHGNNILYDWRSPICSLFYDYETGPASYEAPGGTFTGTLKRKRQYKIERDKLLGVFDNSLNIDDEFLQDVLAEESTDHMKNVVNTIQKEQNQVIRNTEDNHLIVNGIAGSGKTTVALHRIAFLLYRIPKLTSQNILIFSPNNIFTDYISEVLPSLGEANTLETTFDDYLSYNIDEFKEIEPYTDFVARYYSYKELNPELVTYKQSNDIIKDINNYLTDYISKASFTEHIVEGKNNRVEVYELNNYLQKRYNKAPLFERINLIAEKLSSNFYKGSSKHENTFKKLLKKSSNFYQPISDIINDFFTSKYSKIKKEKVLDKKEGIIKYEDALIYTYVKGCLEGFPYEGNIKEVVIDEAQDYNLLQYLIISRIFRKANFTILGDINQNINPYYHYKNLSILEKLFSGSTKYIELLKTYRSSPEIIDYTNKILNLNHVSAIRRTNNKPVVVRHNVELKKALINDINNLKKDYSSIAIITKDDKEASKLHSLLEKDIDISLVELNTKNYNKKLIIIPAYLAKGLEFDAVIVYNNRDNSYRKNEKNLLYVACTRAQHILYIYN